MPTVEVSTRARKDLRKLTNSHKVKVSRVIDYLEKNPYFGKRTEGEFKGLWKVKTPPFKVIYSYAKGTSLITIVSIGYREGIYKRLGL